MKDDEVIFRFGLRQALKILKSACQKSGAVCMPEKDGISWKDLRSGMACHLFNNGWTYEEVNIRLVVSQIRV